MEQLGLTGFTFDWSFVMAFLSIVLIDIVLAGDNAVIIALAVRSLPPQQRRRGIILGAGAAVIMRVVLTFCAAQLLTISFVKLLGGILILWIAVKLFMQGAPECGTEKVCSTLRQAIVTILIADLVMSLDNILAVAGASKGNLLLLLFGLGLSIPFVIFTSNLISGLMDRFPLLIYVAAAVLGRVAGEMIVTDPYVHHLLQPGKVAEIGVQVFFAFAVIAAPKLWMRWRAERCVSSAVPDE